MRARRVSSILLTAFAAVVLLAGCSNPTDGTATLGTDVSAARATTADSPTAQLSETTAADQPPQTTPAPVVSTLTVTTTAAPISAPAVLPPTPIAPTLPAVPATDLDGEVHGFVTAVDVGSRQITVDKVDWFTGADAQQACAEDGITSTDNNWCTGYYYRNVNPMLRVVGVSPQASIVTLAGSVNPVPSDLSTVASRVATTHGTNIYDFTVSNGVVTELREIYHP